MNNDDLIANLAQPPGDPDDPVIQSGLRRLTERLRQLDDDPAEADQIDEAAELVEADDEAYRSAVVAMERHDHETAERNLRRLARRGHGEAAYWLAQILLERALPLRFAGRHRDASRLTSEANGWIALARRTGAAEVLEDSADEPDPPSSSVPPVSTADSPTSRESRRAEAVPKQYAVGVDLRPFEFTVVLTDSTGTVLCDRHHRLSNMAEEHVVARIADAIPELVAGLNRDIPRRDIALGVQLGGPVDSKRGVVLFFRKHLPYLGDAAPDFRWDRFPLAERLQQATGYATVVENDANAFAERERWLGVGKLARRFVVVLIREGIGGSVVSRGEIFSGPVEIGQFINSIGGLRPADTGQMGTIEARAGIAAIIEEIADKTHRDIRDVNEAAALAADPATSAEALEVFTSAGVAIACTIGYLINFAWPSHAVLYGPSVMLDPGQAAARAFLAEAEKFNNFVAFDPHRDCEFITRPLHLLDGAQGAALLALSRCHQIRPLPPSSIQPESIGWRP